MKNAKLIALVFTAFTVLPLATVTLLPQAARASDDPAVCDCRGGGGFPGPFDGANLKVELSDGDMYALQGRVVFLNADGTRGHSRASTPYFEVDLREHPWLANARRKSYPYYPLLGSLEFWRGLEGQEIELSTQAQGQAIYDSVSGTASYDLALLPIAVYLPKTAP